MFPVRCCVVNGLGRALLEETHAQQLVAPDFAEGLRIKAEQEAGKQVDPVDARALAQMGEWLGKHGEQMQKKLVKTAIKSAVAQTGVTLTLNAVPVVGQAIAGLYSLYTTYSNKKYQDKCEDYAKKRVAETNALAEDWQKRLDAALADAYKRAYRGAVELALSNQPLVATETTSQDFINPSTYHKTDGLGAFDSLTGKRVWERCRRELDRQYEHVKTTLKSAMEPMIARTKERGFTDTMRLAIAREIRKAPGLLLYYRMFGAGTPLDYLRDVTRAEEPYAVQALTKAGIDPTTIPAKPGLSTGMKVGLAAAAAGGALLLLRG